MNYQLRSYIDSYTGLPVAETLLLGSFETEQEAKYALLCQQRTGGTLFVLNVATGAVWTHNP